MESAGPGNSGKNTCALQRAIDDTFHIRIAEHYTWLNYVP